MLMLLNVHVTSVLFLVWFNNFTLTMGFYITQVTRSYALLIYRVQHMLHSSLYLLVSSQRYKLFYQYGYKNVALIIW